METLKENSACGDHIIPIREIKLSSRRRTKMDEDVIRQLAQSINAVGILHPVTVAEDGRLVAGWLRLEAVKRLGWERVPVRVISLDTLKTELAQIDENLVRSELTVLERADHLKRAKEVYETLYPESKQGIIGAHGSNRAQGKRSRASEIISFASNAASKTGQTTRSVQQDIQIAQNLTEAVKEALRGTDTANSKTELLALARMEPDQQQQVVEKLIRGEAKKVQDARHKLIVEQVSKEPVPLPGGPFRVIVADPPWEAEPWRRGRPPYPTMSFEEIKALPVEDMAAPDAILWLWTTNTYLPIIFDVVGAWGFEYKTLLTWEKDRMGLGYWLRGQTEHCLLCVRGQPMVTLTNQSTILHGKVREHSRKPEEFYTLVEALCPGSKVELFARQRRPNWAAYGNEIDKFPRISAEAIA